MLLLRNRVGQQQNAVQEANLLHSVSTADKKKLEVEAVSNPGT